MQPGKAFEQWYQAQPTFDSNYKSTLRRAFERGRRYEREVAKSLNRLSKQGIQGPVRLGVHGAGPDTQ